jgi:hypothetical protein
MSYLLKKQSLLGLFVFVQIFAQTNFIEFEPCVTWNIENGYQYIKKYGYRSKIFQDSRIAFNYKPQVAFYTLDIKEKYKLEAAVETGTYHGGTTRFLGHLFERVDTFEVDKLCLLLAAKKMRGLRNIHLHYKSSGDNLGPLLEEKLKSKRLFFYLDARWNNYWPLKDELRQIAKTHKDNCVIMIDDIKVPLRPEIRYDFYTIEGQFQECSFEYIEKELAKVFSDYNLYYLTVKGEYGGAQLLIVPKCLEN